ncbi:MAG TPA: hypothetical protein VKD69_00375 [Vicinamibacterales bacterium]|nr:hypothetical protein [Vicinamibacterales bacterium]
MAILTISAPIAPALAQDPAAAISNVRGIDDASAALIRDLIARSATGRDLVNRIDRSDLVVYVRRRQFPTATLNGRIGFVQSDGSRRLAAIEIAAPRNYVEEIAALGHELQHAVEIASDPTVCSSASLAAFYARIGDLTNQSTPSEESYETHAAAEIGTRVRQEVLQTTAHEN